MLARRFFAALIDFFWATTLAGIAISWPFAALAPLSMKSQHFAELWGLASIALFFFLIAVLLGVPTALWQTTPGKWLFGLEVIGPRARRLTVRSAVLREFAKLFTLFFVMFGWLIMLFYLVRLHTTMHDQLVGSQVVRRRKLTATQKRFREAVKRYR